MCQLKCVYIYIYIFNEFHIILYYIKFLIIYNDYLTYIFINYDFNFYLI